MRPVAEASGTRKGGNPGGWTRRPFVVTAVSIVYLLSPLGNFSFQWYSSGERYSLFQEEFLAALVSGSNPYQLASLILWLLGLIVAYGIWKVRLWGLYGFVAHSSLMCLMNLVGPSLSFRPQAALFVNLPFMAISGYFLFGEIRAPYFNPHLRWWEQNTRFRKSIRVEIGGEKYGTFDIASRGMFVVDANIGTRKPGERLLTRVYLGEDVIDIDSEIVWVNREAGAYPMGFGARFLPPESLYEREIAEYLRALKGKKIPANIRGAAGRKNPG